MRIPRNENVNGVRTYVRKKSSNLNFQCYPPGLLLLLLLYATSSSSPPSAVEAIDAEYPLQLGDIMPNDRRLYDKMRPPKYKGKKSKSKNNARSNTKTIPLKGTWEHRRPWRN